MLLSLPLISIFVLLFFGIAMLLVQLVVPKFAYSWLIAALGALIVWPMILVSRINVPNIIPLKMWDLPGLITTPPALVLDEISWPFAFSLASILLAMILTDVVRAPEADWSTWTFSLLLSAIGLFAVMAGNPLTLMLAWAGLDLAGLSLFLLRFRSGSYSKWSVATLSIKICGIFLLLWAILSAQNSQNQLTFTDIPPQFSIYLLLAAWLHLGIFPIQPQTDANSTQHSHEVLFHLLVAAPSLVLLARIATSGILSWQLPYVYLIATIAVIYGGFSWLIARNEVEGFPFWIFSLSILSLVAAARGQPAASVAWGVATLLSGGLLFLFSARNRYLLIFPAIGLLGISGLPLSLTWNGNGLYAVPFSPLFIFILLSQALILIGYYRIASQGESFLGAGERWIWIVYTWGLLILSISLLIVSWWENVDQGKLITPINLGTVWPSLVVIALSILMITLGSRGWRVFMRVRSMFASVINSHWLFQLFASLYHVLDRALGFISVVLEGEGGILWALLWLVLLLTFLTQSVFGGI
jgi:hypothetical protein